MKFFRIIFVIAILFSFTVPCIAQQERANTNVKYEIAQTENKSSKKATSSKAKKTTTGKKKNNKKKEKGNSYIIGSGDVLRLDTWKEPDFSMEELLVRNDGKITCPLVGDVQAAGLTPTQLTKNLEQALTKYIATPVVTITVLSPQSQVFYILGEVRNTGGFSLNKELTVLQAFALAGGFTEWAAKGDIVVLRKENGKTKLYSVNYKKIAKGKELHKNIIIKANDTIIVP